MNGAGTTPLFCIFGIEYPEVSKSTVSDLTLHLADRLWTFGEFVAGLKNQCVQIIQGEEGDADFKAYATTVRSDHLDILEVRVNTCRGIPKALYYDLILLYYDERRIGDHLLNDYVISEHTIIQMYVRVRKERKMSVTLSTSMINDAQYQPAAISIRVRALVKLRMVQAWQAAFIKYKDCRIRHVMQPRSHRENDFTHIGTVAPFRVDLRQLGMSAIEATRGDACMVQVLAYDKLTQQSCWFDILISQHYTLKRCKERVVEALRQLDWAEASLDEIPHLIARRYREHEIEDFLLCDDTMTLSYILSPISAPDQPLSSPRSVPLLTCIAFVGRRGRRVSDNKGRCIFEEEEQASQLLIAAMASYLTSFVDKSGALPTSNSGGADADKEPSQKEDEGPKPTRSKPPGPVKTDKKLMERERRLSRQISIRSGGQASMTCAGCMIQ